MRFWLLHLFIDAIFRLLKKNKVWFVSRVGTCLWNCHFTLFRNSFSTYLISKTTLISNGQILFGPRARVFKFIIRGVKLAWWSTITDLFNLTIRLTVTRITDVFVMIITPMIFLLSFFSLFCLSSPFESDQIWANHQASHNKVFRRSKSLVNDRYYFRWSCFIFSAGAFAQRSHATIFISITE